MNRLKQLIHEIHRRSLWQVLGIYLLGGWVVLQVVDTLTSVMQLPDWAPTMAGILLLVGLPIVLATAFVQEGIGRGHVARPDDTEGARSEAQPTPRVPTPLTWRNVLFGGMAAFALWGVVAAGWLVFARDGGSRPGPADIRSLVVLPLGNNMGNPDQDYFVDGMTEVLTAELAKVSSLVITSRTSAMRYRNTTKTAPEIARELGVDALVEGSILKGGESVRVTVQLIDGETDQHLWAESYEGGLADAIGLQSRIAAAIAEEIRVALTPAEQDLLARQRPVDPAAQDEFLLGEFFMGQVTRGEGSEGTMRRALGHFQRAVDLDPGWALAHASVAGAFHWMASVGIDPVENYARSKEASARAIALDDTEVRGHTTRAFALYRGDWDFAEAEREYRRADELSPNRSRWGTALMYRDLGRWDEAIDALRHAIERSPQSLLLKRQLAQVQTCAGRSGEAERGLRDVIALEPSVPQAHHDLGLALSRLERHGEAASTMARAYELSGRGPQFGAHLAYVYARAGDLARANVVLTEALEGGADIPPFLHAALGHHDRAVAWYLDQFVRRDQRFFRIHCDPYLEQLRTNPEIRSAMAEAFPT